MQVAWHYISRPRRLDAFRHMSAECVDLISRIYCNSIRELFSISFINIEFAGMLGLFIDVLIQKLNKIS